MSGPLPPPPPPPPGPPPPSLGGGGGSGPPAFLADIRKGTPLKKVPDSLKNDRSAALVPGGGVKPGGGGSSSAVGGGGRPMGPPMGGGGGAVPSGADIRARLNAMFGGAPMPGAAPRTEPQPQPRKPNPPPAPPPPPHRPAQAESNALPFQQQTSSQVSKQRRDAPAIPTQNSINGASRNSRIKPQAPPPPPQNPPNYLIVGGETFKPDFQGNKSERIAPSLPGRETDSWESRFQFPDESTFPPVPEPYHGPKTFVYYRASGNEM